MGSVVRIGLQEALQAGGKPRLGCVAESESEWFQWLSCSNSEAQMFWSQPGSGRLFLLGRCQAPLTPSSVSERPIVQTNLTSSEASSATLEDQGNQSALVTRS